MKGNCVEIGAIQAFLDGELDFAETAKVSSHAANCDACAAILADAEEESAMVFSTLEREFNTLVPTQRLWSKINDSIATEKQQTPFWKKAWAYLTVQLANPSIAVAASVLIVFGIFAAVKLTPTTNTEIQTGETARQIQRPTDIAPVVSMSSGTESTTITPPIDISVRAKISREENPRTLAINASYSPNARSNNSARQPLTSTGYLPGEESYVKTIANMSQAVNGQKDGLMRPSERVSYERDMAVVNDSIKKMRDEVRKNPKNESAKQVLYTSYQNKIDLLNSVSQREELMASLK